jgi:hypothetical protein
MDDGAFNANDLKLKPEQLKNLRPVETGTVKSKQRQKREFIQITRDQFNRLSKATNIASWKVFLHLLFLNWKSPGKPIRLANSSLSQIGVTRFAKCRALPELKRLGLIKLRKRPRKSPEIVVR